MSESQYYVRSRARVRGPYGRDELFERYGRGEVGRMHEISEDGKNWKRATEFPDLFGAVDHSAPNGDQAAASNAPAEATDDSTSQRERSRDRSTEIRSTSKRAGWFYSIGGDQRGPVELNMLQLLVNTGQLGRTDLVWKDGMVDWAPVSTIPTLQSGETGGAAQRVSATAIASLTTGVIGLIMAVIGFLALPAALITAGFCGVVATVFGPVSAGAIRVSKGQLTGRKMATAGLTMGVLATSLAFSTWIAAEFFDWHSSIEVRRFFRELPQPTRSSKHPGNAAGATALASIITPADARNAIERSQLPVCHWLRQCRSDRTGRIHSTGGTCGTHVNR